MTDINQPIDPTPLTELELLVLRDMRRKGYALCLFTPQEVGDAVQEDVEDAMCAGGWYAIHNQTPAS